MLIILSLQDLIKEAGAAAGMKGVSFLAYAGKDAGIPVSAFNAIKEISALSICEIPDEDPFDAGLILGLAAGNMRKTDEEVTVISGNSYGTDMPGVSFKTSLSETETKPELEKKVKPRTSAPRKKRAPKTASPAPETKEKQPSALTAELQKTGGDVAEYAEAVAEAVRESLDPIGFEVVLRTTFAKLDLDTSIPNKIYPELKDRFAELKKLA